MAVKRSRSNRHRRSPSATSLFIAPSEASSPTAAAVRSLGLSPRELDILDRLAAGESNKEIARRLGISPNTVKTHIARVYDKLAVQRRVQAVEKARFLALIR